MKLADIKVENSSRRRCSACSPCSGSSDCRLRSFSSTPSTTTCRREYEDNSKDIAKTVADSSVDILLNRDLAALQSLIDQFVEIQGISYIYIADETGEFLAHTFVPGIPKEILSDDPTSTETRRTED